MLGRRIGIFDRQKSATVAIQPACRPADIWNVGQACGEAAIQQIAIRDTHFKSSLLPGNISSYKYFYLFKNYFFLSLSTTTCLLLRMKCSPIIQFYKNAYAIKCILIVQIEQIIEVKPNRINTRYNVSSANFKSRQLCNMYKTT